MQDIELAVKNMKDKLEHTTITVRSLAPFPPHHPHHPDRPREPSYCRSKIRSRRAAR
jgi:hypothetical protein